MDWDLRHVTFSHKPLIFYMQYQNSMNNDSLPNYELTKHEGFENACLPKLEANV